MAEVNEERMQGYTLSFRRAVSTAPLGTGAHGVAHDGPYVAKSSPVRRTARWP
jgi:hypothetical protein